MTGFTSIHRRLFEGIFKFAGKIRNYDITKKEWVLRGDTVLYVNSEDLHKALEYDLEQEKNFSFKGLSMDDIVVHIAKFISGIWQIHPFGEGNTRTTAVFAIKYLRSIGFDVNNDLFADNSWYFRNALVRANYRNVRKDVEPDMSFLVAFFRNLMMGENNELKNRTMIINTLQQPTEQADRTSTEQAPNKLAEQLGTPLFAIVKAIGTEQCSLKVIMEKIELKHRPTFIANYLTPAIQSDLVTPLYPDSPKHPRQKYLLTIKGLAIFNSTK